MKKIIVVVFCMLIVAGCGSVETVSNQIEVEEQEEKTLLNEKSLDIDLKTSEFNKEENSLHIEYETALPEGTIVEIILNSGHPDSWGEKYDVLDEYVERLSYKEVETTVTGGLISYTFDDAHFNSLPLPSSMIYTLIRIPVTKAKNSFIQDEISTEEDFNEKFPASTTFWFSTAVDGVGYDFRFDDSFEVNEAHEIEEVYAYYAKEKILYKELEKNPFKFNETPTSFTGQVLQIQEEEGVNELGRSTTNTFLRLQIDGRPDEILYVTSQRWGGMEGIYDGDTITVYGELTGSNTYESVVGHQITLPSMDAVIYHK
ncbi:hypothetical protein [Planococcus donghaensis]|uniref:DUF3221 domain-containing protein n=1 Tax=Planococcus donghaensis TaxID=414778 RepID=A0A1C7EDE7_9BACL|nr:hypothetical protein [Planococcus donghaensis]ANU21994.1 hypothetical protein BCM40_00975 [Planococcus donghaensis]